jgi:hypothetical protein
MMIPNPVAAEATASLLIPDTPVAAWHQQDQAILSDIVCSLSRKEVIDMVMAATTSPEALVTLVASFASQSTVCMMQICGARSPTCQESGHEHHRVLQQG